MARITAAELRALTNRDRSEGFVDNLLDELRQAALSGAQELMLPPAHQFNVSLDTPTRNQVKATLLGLGMTVETREFNGMNLTVIKW